MYTLKYIINAPDTTVLLQEFCPEWMGEIQHYKSKRPSLLLRRAVVLALVRRYLRETYHLTLECALGVLIHREVSGAPYLALPENSKLPTDLYISISHTGPWVAFILSSFTKSMAIDIENSQKSRDFTKIADSIFSKKEQSYVEKYGALGFYYLWGAKEALAKWHKKDLEFALSIDLSNQLCPPSQNTTCTLDYNHQYFTLTFLSEEMILTTTCSQETVKLI